MNYVLSVVLLALYHLEDHEIKTTFNFFPLILKDSKTKIWNFKIKEHRFNFFIHPHSFHTS